MAEIGNSTGLWGLEIIDKGGDVIKIVEAEGVHREAIEAWESAMASGQNSKIITATGMFDGADRARREVRIPAEQIRSMLLTEYT